MRRRAGPSDLLMHTVILRPAYISFSKWRVLMTSYEQASMQKTRHATERAELAGFSSSFQYWRGSVHITLLAGTSFGIYFILSFRLWRACKFHAMRMHMPHGKPLFPYIYIGLSFTAVNMPYFLPSFRFHVFMFIFQLYCRAIYFW